MNLNKRIRTEVLVFILVLGLFSLPAWASGFYTPLWADVLITLFITHVGWLALGLLTLIGFVMIKKSIKEGKDT